MKLMYKRTYADRREYLIQAVSKRRKKIREMAIDFLGGKCCFCGYDRCSTALDFHHLDEGSKRFGLSQDGLTRSWTKTRAELEKCILVCANCHREIHAGLLQPSAAMLNGKQGELSSGVKAMEDPPKFYTEADKKSKLHQGQDNLQPIPDVLLGQVQRLGEYTF